MTETRTETIDVALLAAAAVESCGGRYLIGGSLASGFAGEPRSTLDVDMVVELAPEDLAPLAVALGADFYFDVDHARAALAAGSSFNLIHEPSGIKVDLFIARTDLARRQLDRRLRVQLGGHPERTLWMYTPEDILLQKLHWYRLGGEISDRQWRDVMGIVQTQGSRLDRDYLAREAPELGVASLLERALSSGVSGR